MSSVSSVFSWKKKQENLSGQDPYSYLIPSPTDGRKREVTGGKERKGKFNENYSIQDEELIVEYEGRG